MAYLSTKVKLYLDREVDFLDEVIIQDGVIIRWNAPEAQPTQEQLDALDAQGDTVDANKLVRETRKNSYGDIGDQLDEIFKDIDAWKARIQAIKDSNPKS